mgnify:CR=1 FL=1
MPISDISRVEERTDKNNQGAKHGLSIGIAGKHQRNHKGKKTFLLSCASKQERDDWITFLKGHLHAANANRVGFESAEDESVRVRHL